MLLPAPLGLLTPLLQSPHHMALKMHVCILGPIQGLSLE